MIRTLNRLGHGISYTQLEEIDTALCLYKLEAQTENSVAIPKRIQPYLPTTLAWDNIDRLEETLSGKGMSHRVNGIAVQASVVGPHLLQEKIQVAEINQRTVATNELPISAYNVGVHHISLIQQLMQQM